MLCYVLQFTSCTHIGWRASHCLFCVTIKAPPATRLIATLGRLFHSISPFPVLKDWFAFLGNGSDLNFTITGEAVFPNNGKPTAEDNYGFCQVSHHTRCPFFLFFITAFLTLCTYWYRFSVIISKTLVIKATVILTSILPFAEFTCVTDC